MARNRFNPSGGVAEFLSQNSPVVPIPPPDPGVAEALNNKAKQIIQPGSEPAAVDANEAQKPQVTTDTEAAEIARKTQEATDLAIAEAARQAQETADPKVVETVNIAPETTSTEAVEVSEKGEIEVIGAEPVGAATNPPEVAASKLGRPRVNDDDAQSMTIRVPLEIYEWIDGLRLAARKAKLGKKSWNQVLNEVLLLSHGIKTCGNADISAQATTPDHVYLDRLAFEAAIASAANKNAAAQTARDHWHSNHPDQPSSDTAGQQ